ncbi:MAG: putative toxin-antitoxin system toxin component, PIN family [Ramlibacter sp.]|nr:putative toxin-antitoxin system toxin component, PIN family [Ramlibacter sp.]
MKAAPRVVLDTNVVLSALVFGNGLAARVRTGWQSGRFVPLASAATARELVRVLAYPKFRLTPGEQEDLLADYIPWVRVVRIPDPPPQVPACRDASDETFLHLAATGNADVLVSGDKDLLVLAGARGMCPVMAVDAFCRQVLGE